MVVKFYPYSVYILSIQVTRRARYQCAEGYKVEGGDNSQILADIRCVGNFSSADWDGPRPNCERKIYIST